MFNERGSIQVGDVKTRSVLMCGSGLEKMVRQSEGK